MGILGILFQQSRAVIGVKDGFGSGALGNLQGVVRSAFGGLGGIVLDATVSEEHLTTCEVTKNPVEDGAQITDHVQIQPAKLTIEGVISDTPIGFAIIGNIQNVIRSVSTLFGKSSRSIDAYNRLLKLQNDRQPFKVITGLKQYSNMILSELSVPRTKDTGGAIHFRAVMEEIRIVASETTGSPSSSISDLASPVRDAGQKVTAAVPLASETQEGSTAISSQSSGSWLTQIAGFGQ